VASTAVALTATDNRTVGSVEVVLRDISRGGLAGAIVGVLVAGLGGRIVMRLAALAVPASEGRFTENGNRIGDITGEGTIALILFGGLFFGTLGGTVWVVVSPWIPGGALVRAILSAPIAVALTGIGLIHGTNPDFRILAHHTGVVAMLVTLVALAGFAIALVDSRLDDRLPRAGSSSRSASIYATLTLVGGLLVFPLVVQTYLSARTWLGLALVGVGLLTLVWWWLRHSGRTRIPTRLLVAGRAALVVAVVIGSLNLAREITVAIGG
jgi:hypothetical protein